MANISTASWNPISFHVSYRAKSNHVHQVVRLNQIGQALDSTMTTTDNHGQAVSGVGIFFHQVCAKLTLKFRDCIKKQLLNLVPVVCSRSWNKKTWIAYKVCYNFYHLCVHLSFCLFIYSVWLINQEAGSSVYVADIVPDSSADLCGLIQRDDILVVRSNWMLWSSFRSNACVWERVYLWHKTLVMNHSRIHTHVHTHTHTHAITQL
jgi:hypothetical protein